MGELIIWQTICCWEGDLSVRPRHRASERAGVAVKMFARLPEGIQHLVHGPVHGGGGLIMSGEVCE